MSSDRGKRLQRALAAYLRRWWVNCESNPNGRSGIDILGTPGVAFECKTAREFRPLEWGRQARRNAGKPFAALPIVVWFPDRTGATLTGAAMMLLTVDDGMRLLEQAGYAPAPVVQAGAVDEAAG